MSILEKIKLALKLNAAFKRLKEEYQVGHLKAGIFGLGSAVVVAITAKVFAVCPDLATQWQSLLAAGALAGLGVYLKSPSETK